MALTPQTISQPNARKSSKRVGRGNASQKGTTAGRGGKGQTARSGGRKGNKLRSLKRMLQQVPKSRGFKSLQTKAETVTLGSISRISKAGEVITPVILKKKGLIGRTDVQVKVVGTGTIDHAITLKGCLASKTALALIEKAGGKLVY